MTKVKSLCVYCGASSRGPDSHKEAASRLGAMMATRGIRLIYGGGRVGMMGIIADAVLAGGGEVTGVIPRFLDEFEVGHEGLTHLEIVDSMHERKSRMFELSDGFVILPGGLGTMDETFEMATWRQLGLHDKPIVVVNQDGYWTPAKALIDHIIASDYASADSANLIRFVDQVDDIFDLFSDLPESRVAVEAEKF